MREALISSGTVQSIGPRVICSLLFVLVLLLTGVHPAQAEPPAITQAKSQAAALEAQLKALNVQAGTLMEKYDSAITQLAQTKADAADDAALLTQVEQDQVSAENALSDRLAQIYKQGRNGNLDVLLSSTSWSDLVNRVALLERIGKQDASLLKQVTTYRAQVADRQVKLAALLEKQQAVADQALTAGQAVTQQVAQSAQLLKGKETQIAQLQNEWQAQQATQARLQREAQAKLDAALAAAQSGAQAAGRGDTQPTTPTAPPATTHTTTTQPATPTTTRQTAPGGGQTQHGSSNILKPEQIALVAQKAGFTGENLVIAVAVAMAESGGNADAIGGMHTYGLWQILSYAHPDLIDPNNPDASKWYDPYVNAGFAWKISSGGSNWVPWQVYTTGAYLRNMDTARAGVNLLLTDPQSVVPPSVK
jgi:peptidoglycan hydrolase CwlO-like protein